RGELTSFAGGSPGNRAFEQQQFAAAPYTEADLQHQYDALSGPGARLKQDIADYVAGVNAYLAAIRSGAKTLPGEYTALGRGAVDPWQVTDVVATAALVGGIFGRGGGGEVASAVALVEARARYGDDLGTRVWQSFRSADDPEAPVTLHAGQSYPYGQTPAAVPGRVLPDRGSVVAENPVTDPSGSAVGAPAPGLALKPAMSNALVVSGQHTASGHPIAVFGPQIGYFAPQLLLALDLQGPGISARGAAFAGVSMYVLLGRGQDYAWSATSAGQDITDTFAPELCDPAGGPATIRSAGYRFRGQCVPIEVISKHNTWTPSMADGTAAGGYTLVRERTKLGIVTHRGLVGGKPVAFTSLRSTYLHEPDSGIGFAQFNDPAAVHSAAGFIAAAGQVGYAFNWFYVDSQHTAYVNSGANPVRAAGADPSLPNRADPAFEWQGWDPVSNTADYEPLAAHPQAVDQDYFTSWNNKQAAGTWAADDQFGFGPVFRSSMLDERVAPLVRAGGVTRSALAAAAEDAATVDLRGDAVLPLALRVIGSAATGDSAVDSALAALRTWSAAGAHRSGSGSYQYPAAIRIMDAWWPRWVAAEFAGLGQPLSGALTSVLPVDDPPGHSGSAFQHGWYSYVHKDLRTVLGDPVADPLPVRFCGDPAACRSTLIATLKAAAAVPAEVVYPADGICGAGDQFCHDQIVQRPVGGISQDRIAWQNRPTYQQVAEFPARRGDDLHNLALGKVATASGSENGLPPSAAVDGDPATRWASSWEDSQWIALDLGARTQVGRVLLDWEAAYGRDYQLQVSDDGSSWRTVAAVSGSDGGRDVVGFSPVQARYVRILGTARATGYGYSLYEMSVYAQ
ncbi:MAG: hypothetical protein QOJ50_3901, partial [Cryptosporangiaceae bacterium]|nr:hypothetical protein [Cryptosporangiaceae bacterium]